jgi:hypothetical protein
MGGCFWKKEVEEGRVLLCFLAYQNGRYDLLSLDIGNAVSGEPNDPILRFCLGN